MMQIKVSHIIIFAIAFLITAVIPAKNFRRAYEQTVNENVVWQMGAKVVGFGVRAVAAK
jgi:hypothetical protein